METQAGPNEDSRDDENDDEAEEDDSTEKPHDFLDSFKPLITKVEQLFTGWKHGILGATKQLFKRVCLIFSSFGVLWSTTWPLLALVLLQKRDGIIRKQKGFYQA